MASLLVGILFLIIPVGLLVWAIVSTVLFFNAHDRFKKDPESISEQTLRTRRILMIVSLAMVGAMFLCVIAVIVLFFSAIAYM